MLIKVINLENDSVKYTNNFYFFEEQGIMTIKDSGETVSMFGQKFKIEFVKEANMK